eukprot:1196181-Prorocentrum_minimum.AAC.11
MRSKSRTHNAVATRARAVRCVSLSEDQNKVMRTAALVGGVSLAMLASQTPAAHAAQNTPSAEVETPSMGSFHGKHWNCGFLWKGRFVST